jgi:hypothetical protein
MRYVTFMAAAAASLSSSAAYAALVPVASYSMPNGDGQASSGSFNYWDKNYNGSGATTTDGAPLTGGTGDLTDGVIASDFWYNVENSAGTGPYVGWIKPNPLITFNFVGAPSIGQIDIHIDNSGVGGVFAPAAILVDGVSQSFTAPALGSIGVVSLSGLNLTGTSHTLQFQNVQGDWVFVSEVVFSTRGVPEPASWAMMLGGFGAIGGTLRSRRKASVSFA